MDTPWIKHGNKTLNIDAKYYSHTTQTQYYFDKTLAHKKVIELCRSQNEDFAISEKALCDALKKENISICDKDITLP